MAQCILCKADYVIFARVYFKWLHVLYVLITFCVYVRVLLYFFISPLLLLLAFALSAYISILKRLVGLFPSVAVVFHSFS